MHQRGRGKVSAAASVSASASASASASRHALTVSFPTSNALAGGGGGQGRDCPIKLSVQVSSTSPAAVRPRVPRALTVLFPDAAQCVSRWSGEFRVVRPRPASSHLSLRRRFSSGSSSSAASVRITRQVITVPAPSSSLAPVRLPSASPTLDRGEIRRGLADRVRVRDQEGQVRQGGVRRRAVRGGAVVDGGGRARRG